MYICYMLYVSRTTDITVQSDRYCRLLEFGRSDVDSNSAMGGGGSACRWPPIQIQTSMDGCQSSLREWSRINK